MSKYARTLLALVGATIVLSALVSGASAGRLSTSSRNIRATWSSLEFIEPLGTTVRCPLTLEGSLHSSTIAKVLGALIGHISRGTINDAVCSGGRFTILQASLPWHVRYNGFVGTLPNITALKTSVIGMSYRSATPAGICLFTSTAAQPLQLDFSRSTVTRALTAATVGGPMTSNEGCGPFGTRITLTLGGTSNVPTVLGGAAAITITLI